MTATHKSDEAISTLIETLVCASVECERLREVNADLLAALEQIVFQVCQGSVLERDACITTARAAIAKADQLAALEVIAEARADIARTKGEQA